MKPNSKKKTVVNSRKGYRTTSIRIPNAVMVEVDRLARETHRSRSAMIGVLLERIVLDQREGVS